MTKSFSFLVLFLVLSVSTRAAEVTDLGQGLSYLRVSSLADSLQPVSNNGALVLDLRYTTTAADDSATLLKTALVSHPTGTPLFVLVSPATPAVLAPVITASPALTLGAPGSVPTPKVVVQTEPAADRRAYDAFTSGTPLARLLSGKVEKERYDEATLVDEFKHGVPAPEPPPAPDPTSAKFAPSSAPPAATLAEPLTDRVLQRAVHLHAALLALRPRS